MARPAGHVSWVGESGAVSSAFQPSSSSTPVSAVSIRSSMSCSFWRLSIAGVAGQMRTCNRHARLDVPARDPNDIGLPEYELRCDLLQLRLSPGGAWCRTGDPGAKFRSLFSCSVTGDILGRMPIRDKLKGGMVAWVSQ